MNLENIVLSEISQRKTNTVYHLHIKSKKIKRMYMHNRNRLTDIENKLVVISRKSAGERSRLWIWNQKIQIHMYKTDKQQGYIVQHKEL